MSKYFWQFAVLLLFLCVCLTFFYWDAHSDILKAVGAGSLASSAVAVFTKPHTRAADPYRMVLAYFISIAVGMAFRFGYEHWFAYCAHSSVCWPGYLAVLAVVVSLLVMLSFKIDHPPAAGLALILVLDVHDYRTLIIILISVMMLAIIRKALGPWMHNLILAVE